MKLFIGAIAYLCVVTAVVAAVLAGVSSLERHQPKEAPVLAMATDEAGAGPARAAEETPVDPNRVPVWIVPTAKYEYTPVEAVPRPKIVPAIGKDARDAMARTPPRTRPRPVQHEAVSVDPAPRMTSSRRDNDPFYRD